MLTNLPKIIAQNITTEIVFSDLNKTNVLSNTIKTLPHIENLINTAESMPTITNTISRFNSMMTTPRHQKILTSSLIVKKYEEIKKLVIGRSKTHSDIFYGHTHGSFEFCIHSYISVVQARSGWEIRAEARFEFAKFVERLHKEIELKDPQKFIEYKFAIEWFAL